MFSDLDIEEATPEELVEFERLIKYEPPIWPTRYAEQKAECGFRFVTECWWTDNESDQSVDLIPAKEYVEKFCYDWYDAYTKRQPMITEKSRRIMISWICRGLETWVMGLQRGSWLIVDQYYENSAAHLWRIHYSLNHLRDRRPEFKLGKHKWWGAVDKKQCDSLLLPNGSIFDQSHQDAGAEQGKGKTGITLEELSKYRNPSGFWGQALIVTQGSGAGKGGWVNAIANASPNFAWHEIKGGTKAREFLGLGNDWL